MQSPSNNSSTKRGAQLWGQLLINPEAPKSYNACFMDHVLSIKLKTAAQEGEGVSHFHVFFALEKST